MTDERIDAQIGNGDTVENPDRQPAKFSVDDAVRLRNRAGVVKNTHSILKGHTMFAPVALRFDRIPFELGSQRDYSVATKR